MDQAASWLLSKSIIYSLLTPKTEKPKKNFKSQSDIVPHFHHLPVPGPPSSLDP